MSRFPYFYWLIHLNGGVGKRAEIAGCELPLADGAVSASRTEQFSA